MPVTLHKLLHIVQYVGLETSAVEPLHGAAGFVMV